MEIYEIDSVMSYNLKTATKSTETNHMIQKIRSGKLKVAQSLY